MTQIAKMILQKNPSLAPLDSQVTQKSLLKPTIPQFSSAHKQLCLEMQVNQQQKNNILFTQKLRMKKNNNDLNNEK